MSKEKKKIEMFIPAQALEHHANGEDFDLIQKICAAVHRFVQNNNFNDLVTIKEDMPTILLEKYTLDKVNLGYNVVATLLI